MSGVQEFTDFLIEKFGRNYALNDLARPDIGEFGSLGGGIRNSSQRAVVLVHGVGAGPQFLIDQRVALNRRGISNELIFYSCWGSASSGFNVLNEELRCEHSRKLRRLMEAVMSYTNNKIDVIAYSMGSPLARKAILGGTCVDTLENLGNPIGQRIQNYISVGGANRGSYLCGLAMTGICNIRNGLSCLSAFLIDINSKGKYEAQRTINITSKDDEIVGYYNLCGQKSSDFPGAEEIVVSGTRHHETLEKAFIERMKLLQ